MPKISLISTDPNMPFKLIRIQFPLRLFTLPPIKAQGQTFKQLCIYSKTPVLAHGQLYVAFSWVKRPDDVKIIIHPRTDQGSGQNGHYTVNVVYREIVLHLFLIVNKYYKKMLP